MPAIISKLQSLLLTDDVDERCGLILKGNKIIEVPNEHPEPAKGFKIPVEALHENEENLIGTWHTHPGDTANLSQEDYNGFCQWPELKHYIIGVDSVRCFEVADGLIVEADL